MDVMKAGNGRAISKSVVAGGWVLVLWRWEVSDSNFCVCLITAVQLVFVSV